MKPRSETWTVQLSVPQSVLDACTGVLELFVETVSWFLDDPMDDENDPACLWRLEGVARTPPDGAAIQAAFALAAAAIGIEPPAITVKRLVETDWVAANLRDFPPIRAGRFFVHGSHFAGPRPAGGIPLMVDAGTAFGSGEHATTQGCLLAIDGLLRRRSFANPLDLGCGSGILAIALAKALRRRVHAADIDPAAVAVARRNARTNGVAGSVRAEVSDGYGARTLARHLPYDLIVANILARPLASMAAGLGQHLAPGGVAVLSGLLDWQERFVLAAHRMQGLSLVRRLRINGWSTLVLARSSTSAPPMRLLPPTAAPGLQSAAPTPAPTATAD